jgi:hypothetical protein
MQPVSATYEALLAAGAPKEVRVIIAGTTYTQANIVSATTKGALFEQADTIGNAVAKELDLVLRSYNTIPRMAKIQVEFRLNDGTTQSEWLPKGTYYIDTRDEWNGVISIVAYDAMLKADTSYTTSGEQGGWPKTDLQVVQAICSRIGITLDPRTEAMLTGGYQIQYPGFGEDAYTMRELLQFIGQMYAGNWWVNDMDKLMLVGLGDIPKETNYLVEEHGDYILIGGYRILV